jgi:hypothetical protein
MSNAHAHDTCSWCKAKLGRGAVLLTAAISEHGSRRPMCFKCAVWSFTGRTPPYVSAARAVAGFPRDREHSPPLSSR